MKNTNEQKYIVEYHTKEEWQQILETARANEDWDRVFEAKRALGIWPTKHLNAYKATLTPMLIDHGLTLRLNVQLKPHGKAMVSPQSGVK